MIKVIGDKIAIAAVAALAKDGWKDRELGIWADDERSMLEKEPYPPERSGQRYIRTGRLGHSWRNQRPRKMVRVITNRASTARSGFYGGYVVGQQQAYMHRNRWYIASELVEADLPKLIKRVGNKGVKVFEAA